MSSHLSIFKNSTALITGASSGIGKAYAQKLASLGIHLILTARSEQKLNELANELEKKYNIQVEVIGLDLAQPHAAQKLFDEVQARKLSVDILINNAGFGKWSQFLDQSAATYNEMIMLNMNSVTSLCYLFLPQMLASKKGIAAGDTVKVMSKRGFIKAKAVVTKRLQTLTIDGKPVDTIGIPCHWGFEGATRKGFLANTLTPSVGDANSQTPEYKAFLVNIEKA